MAVLDKFQLCFYTHLWDRPFELCERLMPSFIFKENWNNIKISHAHNRYSVIICWLYTLNVIHTGEIYVINKSPEKIIDKGNNSFLKAWLQKVAHKKCCRNEYYPYIKNLIHQTKFTLSIRRKFIFCATKWGSRSIAYHYELFQK